MLQEEYIREQLELASSAKDAGVGDQADLERVVEILEWVLSNDPGNGLDGIPEHGETCPRCGEWKSSTEEKYESLVNNDTICSECIVIEEKEAADGSGRTTGRETR